MVRANRLYLRRHRAVAAQECWAGTPHCQSQVPVPPPPPTHSRPPPPSRCAHMHMPKLNTSTLALYGWQRVTSGAM